MRLDIAKTRGLLETIEFKKLFIEYLGWDRHDARLEVLVDDRSYVLSAVAQKRGMAAFICDGIPDRPARQKIERQVTKIAHEHIIIYSDRPSGGKSQVWQWVKREAGKPTACREHPFQAGQPGDSLIQKLQALAFSLEDEERLTIVEVAGRARKAFDVERVTKRFYDRFKAEHAAFLKFLKGIPDEEMERWYASVMLNRLMFIYFVQKKGFLDGDVGYLSHKLEDSKRRGKDRFYRDFLCPLFFEGFAKRPQNRSTETNRLLGKVPYLNGGIFMPHQIEQLHGRTIEIQDQAFEKLFEFFDAYQWHLDDRPTSRDNEIRPDVLGYIFEKYINQKQMGAYYTKEDITEYIAKNTVVPFLFGKTRERCKVAFEGAQAVWRLLRETPDRYIYPAIQHGITLDIRETPPRKLDEPLPLPPEIAAGLDNVSRRGEWNKAAQSEYALPTETWRELIARRKRYEELRSKLSGDEVRDINDLITLNLDIRQFAQDVIENADLPAEAPAQAGGPELIRAFWRTLVGHIPEKSNENFEQGITVLDPACGSGAFLFAALNILEPLYEACLDRMRVFVDELDRSGEKHDPKKYADFREVLRRTAEHPNEKYYILKSIVINNLFGVDIMEEAVEICKLRLFLKLVAQVDQVEKLEPLPDIDFNIRAGNTLVGFASLDDVKRSMKGDLFKERELPRIDESAEIADRAFQQFRRQQTDLGGTVTAEDKRKLVERLGKLAGELDRDLASEYGIIPTRQNYEELFRGWRVSHKPFHWFAEFYGIMKHGGFDVVIGNPPYVELTALNEYQIRGYTCEGSSNLYALVIERCSVLGQKEGCQGFIVPVSSVSTDRYMSLQRLLIKRKLHFSSYDDRPSRLFDGLEHIRLTIHLIGGPACGSRLYSTRYNKWAAEERPALFSKLTFTKTLPTLVEGTLPKLCSEVERSIIRQLAGQQRQLSMFYSRTGQIRIFYSRKVGYFLQVLNFEPRVFDGQGHRRPPTEFKELNFSSEEYANFALCCLNSNLFYWFVTVFSDCRHVNKREVDAFPVNLETLATSVFKKQLVKLGQTLMENLQKNSVDRTMRFQHDTLTVQCIYPKASKPILDEIDRVLAQHYGFTDEELDFIINYDIKYRMGQAGGEENGE